VRNEISDMNITSLTKFKKELVDLVLSQL
jgi:hypothetical protein